MDPAFTSLGAFLEMGGYAAYVWPSLGIAAAVMIGCLVQSLRSLRAREAVLAALEAESAEGDPAAGEVER